MKAYVIVQENIHNDEMFTEYRAQVLPTVQEFGGTFIVRGGTFTVVEGGWPHPRLVIIEFPSRAAAEGWDLAARQFEDAAAARIGDVYVAVGSRRHIVEKAGARRLVLGGDLTRSDIDLDQFVDVADVHLAVGDSEALGRLEAVDPLLDLLTVHRHFGDVALGVLAHRVAVDVRNINDARGRIRQRAFGTGQTRRLPNLGGSRHGRCGREAQHRGGERDLRCFH